MDYLTGCSDFQSTASQDAGAYYTCSQNPWQVGVKYINDPIIPSIKQTAFKLRNRQIVCHGHEHLKSNIELSPPTLAQGACTHGGSGLHGHGRVQSLVVFRDLPLQLVEFVHHHADLGSM